MEDVSQNKKLKTAPSQTASQIDVLSKDLAAKGTPTTLPRRDEMPAEACVTTPAVRMHHCRLPNKKVNTNSRAHESYTIKYKNVWGTRSTEHDASMVRSQDKDCSTVHRAEDDMG